MRLFSDIFSFLLFMIIRLTSVSAEKILKVLMISSVDTLPTVQLPKEISPKKLLPTSDITIDVNDTLVDQLSERHRQSCLIYSNVCAGAIVVLWLGQKCSALRTSLIEHFKPEDITLILFSTEEQLWYWLNTNSSLKVASLVIEMNINIQNLLSRSHAYKSVRSILVRCRTHELIGLQRFSRSYIKIDGIYDDDTRILIKLVIDLALVSEEIGDEEREDKNNELEAQRNYDRAMKLCALARRL